MKTRYFCLLGAACLVVLTLGACRSSKHTTQGIDAEAGTTAVTPKPKKDQWAALLNANRQTAKGIRGKMNIALKAGSTPLEATGTIKMKRDEIIQLSVVAFGLMEVARMELTPDYLFIQDRYHKRYLQARWEDIPALHSAGIDFRAFQALFWNELFVPGQTAQPMDGDFDSQAAGKKIRLQPKAARQQVGALFYTDDARKLLQQTSLVSSDSKVRFDGVCGGWNPLDGKPFPTTLRLQVSAKGKAFAADLTFTHLQVDEAMGDIRTSVSAGKYTKVTIEEILSLR